jgi:hypothetical protein
MITRRAIPGHLGVNLPAGEWYGISESATIKRS